MKKTNFSLREYSGVWDYDTVAHLLRRTTFGFYQKDMNFYINKGLRGTIKYLLNNKDPKIFKPIILTPEKGLDTKVGDTWVDLPFHKTSDRHRIVSLKSWQMCLLLKATTLQEKMTLFWHNHFVAYENDANCLYSYIQLLKQNSLGNFKELCKQITIEPVMLRYLSGRSSTKEAPNENYARELLELFTLGRGKAIGDGNYSTYKEEDIRAAAKILTGWMDSGVRNPDSKRIKVTFLEERHDKEDKVFSKYFGNRVIKNANEKEYEKLIDLIFEHEHIGVFLCEKIYRWFVNSHIDAEIEDKIILEMATTLRANNFELKPVIALLLKSEHFFDKSNRGAQIKSPLDFLAGLYKQLQVVTWENDKDWNRIDYQLIGKRLAIHSNLLGQAYFAHPNVAGWTPYYKKPLYDKLWISPNLFQNRATFIDLVLHNSPLYTKKGLDIEVDVFAIIENISTPEDPNQLIKGLSKIFLIDTLSAGRIQLLKEILLGGLSETEWTDQFNQMSQDEYLKTSIRKRLLVLIKSILNLPEYHCM